VKFPSLKLFKLHKKVFRKVNLKKHKWKKLTALGIVLLFLFSFYFFILRDLPLPTKLSSASNPQSTLIYDRNGKLLYNIYDKKNQSFIPLASIPKYMQEATISIEDKSFYQHGAVDFKGIARAAFSIIVHRQVQGGSTLTQQLVKNSLLTQEQTILRKIKEVVLAFATEAIYSKSQILEMYLNQTPYGGTAYGIEAASEYYFGKHAKDLDLAESAMLAGLPQAPTEFSPFGAHPEEGRDRQIEVLAAMQDQGYITKDQEQKAEKEVLKYKKFTNEIEAPHFVLYVKDLLIAKYGEKTVEEGGLKVITSLDLNMQNYAQSAVADEVDKLPEYYHVTNGSALITQPGTGEILAMVGSKDYFDPKIAGNVNVTTSLRQPGSSIKPINYAVGLLHGYNAATTFIDQPICFPNQGGKDYCPLNYDLKWHGLVQMRYALGNSLNIPAVKMLELNGVNAMVATASAMGITTFTQPERYGLSLTLGGAEVKMVDMATAFGVFANSGYRVDLQPILKVTDKTGKVLEKYTPPLSPIFGKKVLPDGVAFIISDILADNNARLLEFGDNSELKIPGQTVSVKTGTTNDFRDNWTIGYTPSFLVASWVGNDDNTPMSGLASGITGAAPIWNDIMSHLLKGRSPEPLSRPPDVIQKAVCSDTGLATSVTGASCPTRFEYILKGTENNKGQIITGDTQIDKNSQNLPAKGQTDNLDTKNETVYVDPTGDRYCLTCPHPSPTPQPGH
jgi:1A family penicillin-binding protein